MRPAKAIKSRLQKEKSAALSGLRRAGVDGGAYDAVESWYNREIEMAEIAICHETITEYLLQVANLR